MPAETPEERAGQLCVAPWHSVRARGFIPRIYLLDKDGWPLRYVDGLVSLRKYDQAVEAASLLRINDDDPTVA